MNFDLTEAETIALLAKVNTAIEELITGKRATQIRIRSDDFDRNWSYSEVSLENLRDFKANLLDYIGGISATPPTPTFRVNSCIPLIVRK